MPEVSSDILNHFKGFCTTPSVIMLFVYMKCRFSLSYRELEEMMSIRVANVDHSTLQRWVKRFYKTH
jgi:transposase-like protein